MHIPHLRGVGTSEEPDQLFLFGYNGTGAEVAKGTPVCFDAPNGDGKTFKLPTTTTFSNLKLFAGIADATIGTAEYTTKLLRFGKVQARTYGVGTTFIPGASLVLVAAKSYLAYGTEGELVGQGARVVALQTNATTDTSLTNVFVQF